MTNQPVNIRPYRWKIEGDRRVLVTSLANGFDIKAISAAERYWLRKRRLVNQTGLVTDRGRAWASQLLAEEADRILAGEICWDIFSEE